MKVLVYGCGPALEAGTGGAHAFTESLPFARALSLLHRSQLITNDDGACGERRAADGENGFVVMYCAHSALQFL